MEHRESTTTVRVRRPTHTALAKAVDKLGCSSIAELLARVEAGDMRAIKAWQEARWGK